MLCKSYVQITHMSTMTSAKTNVQIAHVSTITSAKTKCKLHTSTMTSAKTNVRTTHGSTIISAKTNCKSHMGQLCKDTHLCSLEAQCVPWAWHQKTETPEWNPCHRQFHPPCAHGLGTCQKQNITFLHHLSFWRLQQNDNLGTWKVKPMQHVSLEFYG